jgi:serine/threonine protein kinase
MHETDQLQVILNTLGAPTERDCEFLKDEKRTKLLMEMHKGKSKLRKLITSAEKNAINLLKKMLEFNPMMRATVDECLEHEYFAGIRGKASEVAAPAKLDFDFEAKIYLNKEKLKELIDEELNYFKGLRDKGKIIWK